MVSELVRNWIKKGIALTGLGMIAWLLSACGYPTPQGGGGLTPFVVVVTPTALPQTPTAVPPTPNAPLNPTRTAAATPEVVSTIPPNTAAPTPRLTPTLAVVGNNYTVQPGDTLLGISIRLKVDYNDLVDLNKIEDPNKLQVGQALKIPPRPASTTDSTPTPKS
ncbi:MAG: putative peptidase [Chloroflexi bacterium]|nr:putative peptidase [Chloroflexota bacterium]